MLIIWTTVFIIIFVLYVFLIIGLYRGLDKFTELKVESRCRISFTIIIPFRNEADNLPMLLESISKLDYPKDLFEILFVNDDSDDNSVELIQEYKENNLGIAILVLKNVRSSVSPKKDAITTAIASSKYPWILSTDADCILPKQWLQAYDTHINYKNSNFVAGPVVYQEKKGFLHQFQKFDWISLMGAGMGAFGQKIPILCSGANLAYRKEAFVQIKGFQGNEHIASGDDVFLLNKMRLNFPNKVHFIKSSSAIVQTYSLSTWEELMMQRVRWAKKTGSIQNVSLNRVGGIVILTNVFLLILLFLSYFDNIFFLVLSVGFFSKLWVDSLFVLKTAKILNQKIDFFSWLLSSFIYPFFNLIIIIVSLLFTYQWKGRKFAK